LTHNKAAEIAAVREKWLKVAKISGSTVRGQEGYLVESSGLLAAVLYVKAGLKTDLSRVQELAGVLLNPSRKNNPGVTKDAKNPPCPLLTAKAPVKGDGIRWLKQV
jgi:hypothetical protein